MPDSTPHLRALWVLLSVALLGLYSAAALFAQESPPSPKSPGATSAGKTDPGVSRTIEPVALFVMLDKKSIVFPDIVADSSRMSTGRKFKLFVDNSVSLHTFAVASLGSAIDQAADSPHGYGQGGDGYGQRFGASMARVASSNFFGTFLLASALHQDPRFFPERHPAFGRSMKYSLKRLIVTRNDDGRNVANWSGLLGPALSEGLSNAYWPEQERTAGRTVRRYGTDLAVRFAGNMLREYWPVFSRRVAARQSRQRE